MCACKRVSCVHISVFMSLLCLTSSCCLFQLAAKYDIEKEQEARVWIEAVVGEPVDSVSSSVDVSVGRQF